MLCCSWPEEPRHAYLFGLILAALIVDLIFVDIVSPSVTKQRLQVYVPKPYVFVCEPLRYV